MNNLAGRKCKHISDDGELSSAAYLSQKRWEVRHGIAPHHAKVAAAVPLEGWMWTM